MGLIFNMLIAVGGLAVAISVSTIARLLADDAKEWLPWMTNLLVECAIRRLPEDERVRFTEEWWSHINEWPGNFAKLYIATGYILASNSIKEISRADKKRASSKARKFILRRMTDVLLSVIMLLFLAPMLILLTIFIKLENSGPVLCSSVCVGENGKLFRLLRFRCLYYWPEDNVHPDKPLYLKMTRIGRFLRKSSLDELPQLINVVCGQMSLFGPQPLPKIDDEMVYLIRNILPQYNQNPIVKPGITGFSQISLYDKKLDFLQYRKQSFIYDQQYINNRNFLSDLKITLKVVKTAFLASNYR